jgi:serine/threonine-protein kinase RsbW
VRRGRPPRDLSQTYAATSDAVRLVRRAIVEYAQAAGMTGETLYSVRLAVSEAVTNVVRHAYPGQPGQVQVTASAIDGELWVLIADTGCGSQSPPENPGLGWGLAVITDASDEFTLVGRAEGGTEARMRFRFAARPSDAPQDRGSVASAT